MAEDKKQPEPLKQKQPAKLNEGQKQQMEKLAAVKQEQTINHTNVKK